MEYLNIGQHSSEGNCKCTECQLLCRKLLCHLFIAFSGKIHGNPKKGNDHNCQQDITKGGRDISCFAPVIHYNIVKHKKILLRLREEEPHRIYIQRKQHTAALVFYVNSCFLPPVLSGSSSKGQSPYRTQSQRCAPLAVNTYICLAF